MALPAEVGSIRRVLVSRFRGRMEVDRRGEFDVWSPAPCEESAAVKDPRIGR